jgi:hypothetical protein
MKLIQTLSKLLKENNNLIQKLINDNYDVKINFEKSKSFTKKYNLNIKLFPKSPEAEMFANEHIWYYASFNLRENGFKLFDTNSAYNKGGMFTVLGLTDELDEWLYNKVKEVGNSYQNINENNNKKDIIYKILRRLPNLDENIDFHMNWMLDYYKEDKIKQFGLKWFIETIIYNLWTDDISRLFEEYLDDTNDIEVILNLDEITDIKNYLKTHFKDKIETTYNNFIK